MRAATSCLEVTAGSMVITTSPDLWETDLGVTPSAVFRALVILPEHISQVMPLTENVTSSGACGATASVVMSFVESLLVQVLQSAEAVVAVVARTMDEVMVWINFMMMCEYWLVIESKLGGDLFQTTHNFIGRWWEID